MRTLADQEYEPPMDFERPSRGQIDGEEFGWNATSIAQSSDGQVVIRNLWLSVDSAQCIWPVSTQSEKFYGEKPWRLLRPCKRQFNCIPAREDPAPGASTCAVSYGGCLGRIYAQAFVKDGTNPNLDRVALRAG